MSHDILKREIIRTIMGNLGMLPKIDFGTHGIAKEEFLVPKTLDIKYDEKLGPVKYNVYAAQMLLNDGKIRTLSTSLNDDLVVVFGFDGLSNLYGLRLDYYASIEDQDWGIFATKLEDGGKWNSANLYDRLMVCAGIEKLATSEYFWSKCNEFEDLFSALIELVEM